MTKARRKQVSAEVMSKILTAIHEIAADGEAPRTKREIEKRTGLSHDAVARAFRQDSEEENQWAIGRALTDLTDGGANRRSPAQKRKLNDAELIADLRQRLAESDAQRHRYAMALYAYQLTAGSEVHNSGGVVPIGRNRKGPGH